jgi:peptidoglycan pentaglycine glycine transferase (the first glycine)
MKAVIQAGITTTKRWLSGTESAATIQNRPCPINAPDVQGVAALPARQSVRREKPCDIDRVPVAGDDAVWDDFVAANDHGHHEQCSWYGLIRKSYGYRCDRAILRDGGEIVAGVQVLSQWTPIGRFAIVKRGPYARNDNPELLDGIVRQLIKLAHERSFVSLRVDTLLPQSAVREALARHGFFATSEWSPPTQSLVMPVAQNDEQLLSSMKQKGRYNVRVAQRHGVTVQVGDSRSIDEFFDLHTMSAFTNDFPVFPRLYYHYLWETFGKHGRLQHFVAYHNEKPVAAIFNTIVGDHMIYGWGGVHRGDEEKKLMANYLLHHRAMCWARDHGCTTYDLCGVTQFKRKLAPATVHWPLPMRMFFGRARATRRKLLEQSWCNQMLRRGVHCAARRLGLQPKLPW